MGFKTLIKYLFVIANILVCPGFYCISILNVVSCMFNINMQHASEYLYSCTTTFSLINMFTGIWNPWAIVLLTFSSSIALEK